MNAIQSDLAESLAEDENDKRKYGLDDLVKRLPEQMNCLLQHLALLSLTGTQMNVAICLLHRSVMNSLVAQRDQLKSQQTYLLLAARDQKQIQRKWDLVDNQVTKHFSDCRENLKRVVSRRLDKVLESLFQ
jgi:hypothetical protein